MQRSKKNPLNLRKDHFLSFKFSFFCFTDLFSLNNFKRAKSFNVTNMFKAYVRFQFQTA